MTLPTGYGIRVGSTSVRVDSDTIRVDAIPYFKVVIRDALIARQLPQPRTLVARQEQQPGTLVARLDPQPREMVARAPMSRIDLGTFYQGDTVQLNFVVQDEDGNAVDLTNATVKWGLAATSAIATPVLTKTSDDDITITDAEAGECSVLIDQGDLDDDGAFYHELEVTLAGGESYTYAQGNVLILPTVYPTT